MILALTTVSSDVCCSVYIEPRKIWIQQENRRVPEHKHAYIRKNEWLEARRACTCVFSKVQSLSIHWRPLQTPQAYNIKALYVLVELPVTGVTASLEEFWPGQRDWTIFVFMPLAFLVLALLSRTSDSSDESWSDRDGHRWPWPKWRSNMEEPEVFQHFLIISSHFLWMYQSLLYIIIVKYP